MESTRWYILYTKSRFERVVYKELVKKGFVAFLPETVETRQWSDRKMKVTVPLFPSYVFVQIDEKMLFEALEVRGAVKFVNFSNEIATIRDEEVQEIKILLTNNFNIEVIDTLPEMSKGDFLILNQGPLKGKNVEFIQYKGKRRGLFSLESIGKSILLDLSLEQVLTETISHS